jgi:hypothetical protein
MQPTSNCIAFCLLERACTGRGEARPVDRRRRPALARARPELVDRRRRRPAVRALERERRLREFAHEPLAPRTAQRVVEHDRACRRTTSRAKEMTERRALASTCPRVDQVDERPGTPPQCLLPHHFSRCSRHDGRQGKRAPGLVDLREIRPHEILQLVGHQQLEKRVSNGRAR